MKTHCSLLGIPSKVHFYKGRRGETRYQNSTQGFFFKKNNIFFFLWKQDLVKKLAGELHSERRGSSVASLSLANTALSHSCFPILYTGRCFVALLKQPFVIIMCIEL